MSTSILQIIVIGDVFVGKTALVARLTQDKFVNPHPTIGADYAIYDAGDSSINRGCLDTTGIIRFHDSMKAWYKVVAGALLVFDVSSRDSFEHCQHWLQLLREYAGSSIYCMLVANKIDLCEGDPERRQVPKEEASSWAEKEGLDYIESSAKSGDNVREMFKRATLALKSRRAERFINSLGLKNLSGLTAETRRLIQSQTGIQSSEVATIQSSLESKNEDDLRHLFLLFLGHNGLHADLAEDTSRTIRSCQAQGQAVPNATTSTTLSGLRRWLGLASSTATPEKPSMSIDFSQRFSEAHWRGHLGIILPFICSAFIHCKSWGAEDSCESVFKRCIESTTDLYRRSGRSSSLIQATMGLLEILEFSTVATNLVPTEGQPSKDINSQSGHAEDQNATLTGRITNPTPLLPSGSVQRLPSQDDTPSDLLSPLICDVTMRISLVHQDPIGGGGFCDLFIGEDSMHGKVALKRPRFSHYEPSVVRRFRREADLWHRVQHPHVLHFIGTCQIGHHVYMVSPFVDNGDLPRYLRQDQSLDRITILRQIADALAYLHSIDIVHGDIKALNVLVSNDHSALLCDFGLSKALGSMETSTEAKGRGSTRWMAPELFTGGPKTKESDVYAYAMTIAEVLTGEVPFSHLQYNQAVMFEVVLHNVRPPPKPLASTDGRSYEPLWKVADRCWSAEPQGRATMTQVLESLDPST